VTGGRAGTRGPPVRDAVKHYGSFCVIFVIIIVSGGEEKDAVMTVDNGQRRGRKIYTDLYIQLYSPNGGKKI